MRANIPSTVILFSEILSVSCDISSVNICTIVDEDISMSYNWGLFGICEHEGIGEIVILIALVYKNGGSICRLCCYS
jgi:hypothetical protein